MAITRTSIKNTERPNPERSVLLGTIVGTFIIGGVVGAVLTLHSSRWAMIVPAGGVLAAAALAFSQRISPPVPEPTAVAPEPSPSAPGRPYRGG